MGIGNKQQNEEVSLLHPEHLSSVTKLTLLAMASIALSGYYRALDYGAWPEGEAGCFLIQVAIKKKKKLFTGKKIGELKPSRNLARVIPHLSAWWQDWENLITLRSEAGPTLPAEVNCVAMPLLLICLGPFA